MYEITFTDTGRTMTIDHLDAEDFFGGTVEFMEIRLGYHPHIVVVEV